MGEEFRVFSKEGKTIIWRGGGLVRGWGWVRGWGRVEGKILGHLDRIESLRILLDSEVRGKLEHPSGWISLVELKERNHPGWKVAAPLDSSRAN